MFLTERFSTSRRFAFFTGSQCHLPRKDLGRLLRVMLSVQNFSHRLSSGGITKWQQDLPSKTEASREAHSKPLQQNLPGMGRFLCRSVMYAKN